MTRAELLTQLDAEHDRAILGAALTDGVLVIFSKGRRLYLYIGRRVPPRWREAEGGTIHLGRGRWLFRVEPRPDSLTRPLPKA